jgi:hypothetical protein
MAEWLELAATAHAGQGAPLRMREEWIVERGPLTCDRCRRAIGAGELFSLTTYCPMGGIVGTGETLARYSDLLEVAAEHVRCAAE